MAFNQTQTVPSEDLVENCRKMEEAGADVVGINCGAGPATILPLIKKVRAACKVSYLFLRYVELRGRWD